MKHKTRFFVIWFALIAALLIASLLVGGATNKEAIQESMRDAVLHESNVIDLFGLKNVNPGLISGFIVTLLLLAFAAVVRIFVVPRFRYVPGRLQMLLEQAVGLFDGLAKSNSPWRNRFLGAYIFAAGAYIFVGTLFELLGLQAVTVSGHSIALPAPLSDVNGAIMMGCLSYLVILSGGIAGNGAKGILLTLKEFSLPISMSFRLFGVLLSGLLVTELVYYYSNLSFGLPVVVGVLFTILHALIQCYVLMLLTSIYYGEVSNPEESGKKRRKKAAADGSLPGAE
ncbi:MAG: F0F1 ATP synthase subunit A [Oscillospiraceae bacterium]|nr:F0F1 ATP synthase subunit A [Oscillospiraceae bacterium]